MKPLHPVVAPRRRYRSARRPLALALAGATLATIGCLSVNAAQNTAAVASAAAQVPGKPNVVLILTDDMRRDELANMPNVQRLLVDKGRKYTKAWSTHPLCCPARAEILTGQYGQNSGVQHNYGPWGGWAALQDGGNNIGTWLQAAGYRTHFIGKYLNGYYQDSDHPARPAGWTRWDAQARPIYAYREGRFWDGSTFDDAYVTHPIRRRALQFIRASHALGKPSFSFVSFISPHSSRGKWPPYERRYADFLKGQEAPFLDDPSFNEPDVSDLPEGLQRPSLDQTDVARESRWWRARARSLRSVDAEVGRIVRKLREMGELSNTYIVFTSDNGYLLGEHRLRFKDLLFDEGMAVPMVVRGPGIPPGSRSSKPVGLIDLAPTFVDWSGATPGRTLDGVSLPWSGAPPLRDTILMQTGNAIADDTPGWNYRGVKTRRYHYFARSGDPSEGVLFDQLLDPHQLTNVYHDPDYAEVRAELQQRTATLETCSGAGCAQAFGPIPPPKP